MIVHADAGDVFLSMPSVSDLEFRICWRRKTSDLGLAAEVNVEVLELGRPIVREHPFGAGTRRPADCGLADTCWRVYDCGGGNLIICRSVNMAICQTARTIEQQIGGDGDAETARTVPNHESLCSDETTFRKPAASVSAG